MRGELTSRTRQAAAGLVALLSLAVLFVACGVTARPWGQIVVGSGQPILLGLAIDGASQPGFAPPDADRALPASVAAAATIDGHPLQIVPVPVHCGAGAASDLAPSATALQGLAGLVGPPCSAACIYSEGLLYELRLTMIAPACTAAGVTQQGFPIAFRLAWRDDDEGVLAAKYASESLGARRAVVIRDTSVHARALTGSFSGTLKARGGSATELEVQATVRDDPEGLGRAVRAARPQLIFLSVDRPDAAGLYAALSAQFPELPLIGTDTVLAPGGCTLMPGAGDPGAAMPPCTLAGSSAPRLVAVGLGRREGGWYSELDTSGEGSPFGNQLQDAVGIYSAAIEKVAKPRPDGSLVVGKQALRDTIARTQAHGRSGRIEFDPSGERRHDVGAALYELKSARAGGIGATIVSRLTR